METAFVVEFLVEHGCRGGTPIRGRVEAANARRDVVSPQPEASDDRRDKNPHLDRAKLLMELVYPDALGFTKLPYRIEWQESKVRIDAIRREGHEKTFKVLGGTAFFDAITEAHDAYGTTLGITAPLSVEATKKVRERLDGALAALRDYVNRVSAHAEPDDAESQALADALLQPLTVWEATHHAAAADEGEAPAEPAPAPAKAP